MRRVFNSRLLARKKKPLDDRRGTSLSSFQVPAFFPNFSFSFFLFLTLFPHLLSFSLSLCIGFPESITDSKTVASLVCAFKRPSVVLRSTQCNVDWKLSANANTSRFSIAYPPKSIATTSRRQNRRGEVNSGNMQGSIEEEE